MNQVNFRDARKQLSRLLDDAEHGKSVIITRHGKQVARLTPVEPAQGKRLPDLSEFRESIQTKGAALSKAVIQCAVRIATDDVHRHQRIGGLLLPRSSQPQSTSAP